MDLTPSSDVPDQTGDLLDRTYLLWRATPLVGFSSRTAHELVQSLRVHLMDDLDYEVYDGIDADVSRKPTVMDASLNALRLDDWDKVVESSQVLQLKLEIMYPTNLSSSKSVLYFLPATLARQTNPSMVDAVDYPLILARIVPKAIAKSIQRWLINNFGCEITNFHVSGTVMEALVNWWTSSLNKIYEYELNDTNPSKKCLELSYYVSFTEHLDSITFTITMDQLRKMQTLIQGTDLTMMDLIQEHVYKTLRIKMNQCILARVGTPIAYLSNTSQMKLLLNGGSKIQYLEFLSELCDLAVTSF